MTAHTPLQHTIRHTGIRPGRFYCSGCGDLLMRDEEYEQIVADKGTPAALDVFAERIRTQCSALPEPQGWPYKGISS